MPFRYLRDPLFLTAAALYVVNRFVLKRLVADGFVHDHFNDLICMPMWAPVVLLFGRLLGLRRHHLPPQPLELLLMVAVWSLLFELVLPRHSYWSRWAHGDTRDIVYYALGAVIGQTFWNRWYAARLPRDRDAGSR